MAIHFRGACIAVQVFLLLCVKAASAATLTIEVVGNGGTPLSNAVVHVYPASGKPPLKTAPGAIIDQISKEFVPLVSVVQTGTSVRFPNKDNIRHQVYSFSPPKRFERRLYSGEKAEPVVFDKPGVVLLGCNIHDRMVAYILVVDTPWFAISDLSGRAAVSDLPPGDYVINVWHYELVEETLALHQSIKLHGDVAVKAAVKVDVPR